jgi:hypothetical protein
MAFAHRMSVDAGSCDAVVDIKSKSKTVQRRYAYFFFRRFAFFAPFFAADLAFVFRFFAMLPS